MNLVKKASIVSLFALMTAATASVASAQDSYGEQGNYCGELADGQTPSRGCWYFLPQQARVLYRARFRGWRSGGEEGVQAWQLVRLPLQTMGTAKTERLTAVELRAVNRTGP